MNVLHSQPDQCERTSGESTLRLEVDKKKEVGKKLPPNIPHTCVCIHKCGGTPLSTEQKDTKPKLPKLCTEFYSRALKSTPTHRHTDSSCFSPEEWGAQKSINLARLCRENELNNHKGKRCGGKGE